VLKAPKKNPWMFQGFSVSLYKGSDQRSRPNIRREIYFFLRAAFLVAFFLVAFLAAFFFAI
jgi:hypothetical protein